MSPESPLPPTLGGGLPREARAAAVEARLRQSLNPLALIVTDDSHKHRGHAGAADGRSHFSVRVVSAAFAALRPLARHRLVYDALGTMMATDIHALAIEALAPGEPGA
jgi:BolA protein